MPQAVTIIICVFAALLAVYIGVAFAVALYTLRPPRRTEEDFYKEELTLKQVKEELYNIPYENLTIKSEYGYEIYARGYFAFPQSNRYAVLIHGYNNASSGMVRFMEIFRKRGINVLIPDNRYSAKTGGKNISFGYYEKNDIIKCIDYIYSRNPQAKIGIMGESMGGATSIMTAASRPDLKFAINYCGYSSMDILLKGTISSLLPPGIIFYPLIKLFIRLLGGFSVKDVEPHEDAKNLKMPVLLMHSRTDTAVPFIHHENNINNIPGAEKVIFEKAQHGLSLNTYPELFEKGINSFLDKINF